MNIHVDDNNEVLLGVQTDEIDLRAGDTINIGGGNSVFFAEYNVTTYQEIDDAYHDESYIVAFIEDSANTIGFFELFKYDPNEATYTFKRRNGAVTYTLTIDDNDTWSASFGTMDLGDLSNRAGFIKSPNVVYCTCDTAAGTAAKTATIVSGTLTSLNTGDQAIVKFANTNTASNPTLDIAGTGAKAIKRYGTTAPGTTNATSWTAGTTFICVYDGTNWMLVSWVNTAYSEISVANITNGTSSSTGLVSGRRVKSAVEEFAPVKDVEVDGESVVVDGVAEITMPTIPTDVSELVNDVGYITEDDIPPLITDLGYIDPEPYEEDLSIYMNTLTEDGFYKFTFGGDDFTYIVQVQSLINEDDGRIYLNQHYWGDEEGPRVDYVRAVKLIDGEVDYDIATTYLTYETASDLFASKNHTHFRTATQAMSVWDYCNSNQISFVTDSPILFTDSRSPKNHWLIETTSTTSSPVNRFIRLTSLADGSAIYQRSGTYSSGVITWGDWYKFSGTVYTP